MKCKYCNKEIPENSAFCPECGGKQKISVSTKYICPTCGAPLEHNDLFCTECGTPCDPVPIDAPSRRSGSLSRQGAGRNILADTEFIKMLLTLAFIILILALAMSLFFLYRKNQTAMVSQNPFSADQPDVMPAQPDGIEIENETKSETESNSETDMDVSSDEDKANNIVEPTKDNTDSDYILPQSTSRLLTSNDISRLSLREINYAKNEIYARHGRRFHSSELQNYFNSKSWYSGTISPDAFGESLLFDTERKNAEFLATTEFNISPNGYQLDTN